MQIVEIYCDGSCSGNPGPGGWSAIIKRGDRELVLVGSAPQTTNNRMELTAVINGLEMIREDEEAILYSDSRYVVDGMNSWMTKWIRNNWRTADGPVKNRDLWEKLADLKTKCNVKVDWLKGHSIDLIERADSLAKEACKKVKSNL